MKKFTSFVLLFLTTLGFAQVPTYFTANTGGTGNAFPMNATGLTTRRVQWTIPANALTGLTNGFLITDVYFQTGSAVNKLYPTINVRFKQGTTAGLTGVIGGPMETGMTLVYQGLNVNVITTASGWLKFTLQTPWAYNPTIPLLIELEQDSPTFSGGPTVLQSTYTGPGNGRQWGDISSAANSVVGTGANLIHFGVDVIPAPVCTGIPPASSISTPTQALCPGISLNIGLPAGTYTNTGYSYVWQTSTVSAFGPWTAIPNATALTVNTPTLNSTQWISAQITCASNNLSYQTNSALMTMAGTTTNNIPYSEDFEVGVYANNILPNCSWKTSAPNSVCQTYTIAGSGNRQPYSGNKFGSFKAPTSPNGDYFYTNGIQLEPGITYSASSWYVTDGAVGWTDYSMWLGTNQTVATLTNVASTNAGMMVNNYYKNLSATFTVSTSGIYYLAMRCRGTGSGYFSFDDVSITAPCSLNSPNLSYFGSNSGCIGQSINFTANGADSYVWNGSVNSQTLSYLVTGNANVQVVGTSSASGCSSTLSIPVSANLSPVVGIIAPSTNLCRGESIVLTAYGANNYVWTNGANTPTVVVSPTTTTTYSVVGVNSFGCSSTSSHKLNVKQPANVLALVSNANICAGETVTLTANGASTYTWSSNNVFLVGSEVVVSPAFSNTYAVTGTDVDGCKNTNQVALTVNICTGITKFDNSTLAFSLYPSPAENELHLVFDIATERNLQIQDLSGRVVYSAVSTSTHEQIDLSELSSGLYLLTVITSDSQVKTIKFAKN